MNFLMIEIVCFNSPLHLCNILHLTSSSCVGSPVMLTRILLYR